MKKIVVSVLSLVTVLFPGLSHARLFKPLSNGGAVVPTKKVHAENELLSKLKASISPENFEESSEFRTMRHEWR